VTKGLVLAGLGIGVISMVDNIVRPLLLSERVHMNGLVVFVSLLGGLSVFGLLGIVLGPIIVVTALALVTSYVESVPEDDPVVRP
jgi:predicted PurR-regulated permease PerM